jgi:hypothetical protein
LSDLWGHYITGSIDTKEKFEAKRYELAKRVWTYMKANDSRECRHCHTTAKMGGPADAFAMPSTIDRLIALVRWCAAANVPITVVGGGSNLLVRDAGVRGVVLNTGRLRDQWHSMTRTGPVPRLMAHSPEPLLHAHPDDAPAADGALVRVASRWGAAVLRLRHDPSQRRGDVFAPMHWTDVWASAARINTTVNPDTDPISGQPELKHTPIAVTPYAADWHGFVLHRGRLTPGAAWQAFIPLEDGVWRHEIAGQGPNPFAQLRAACAEPGATWIVLEDTTHGLHRAAQLRDGRLLSVIMLGPDHALPPRDWLASLFTSPAIGSAARRSLLAGRPADHPPEPHRPRGAARARALPRPGRGRRRRPRAGRGRGARSGRASRQSSRAAGGRVDSRRRVRRA